MNVDDRLPARVPAGAIIQAAQALTVAGLWSAAGALLDAVEQTDDRIRALLAVAVAKLAVESAWYRTTDTVSDRLDAAEALCSVVELGGELGWDLRFLRLRSDYQAALFSDGSFQPGARGKPAQLLADVRSRCSELSTQAPDEVRRGWAQMYLGLIADNLYAERAAAPAHYKVALAIGEASDALLAREALRHLGDHDHDRGDHARALERWRRATEYGASRGAVPGTLSQQLLLAVLANDRGDAAGAIALCEEIHRWATAIGADRIAQQASDFLAGIDPTATVSEGRLGGADDRGAGLGGGADASG